jgi:nucleoside-triphosphatase
MLAVKRKVDLDPMDPDPQTQKIKILLTGKPGVGKTRLVERVITELRPHLRLGGFTTGEVRDPQGERVGFDLTTVEGLACELARVGLPSPYRVGRYGVNREGFERVALPELRRRDIDLLVIDEIGKMECASGRFRRAVEDALDSSVSVLATLGIGRSLFFQALSERPDVELIRVREGNREALAEALIERLRTIKTRP